MADAEPTPPLMTGPELVSGVWALGQTLLFLLPVYLCGYMGLSIVFVIVGLAVYMGWKSKRQGKWNRLQSALDTLQNEEAVTATTISITKTELPSWVSDLTSLSTCVMAKVNLLCPENLDVSGNKIKSKYRTVRSRFCCKCTNMASVTLNTLRAVHKKKTLASTIIKYLFMNSVILHDEPHWEIIPGPPSSSVEVFGLTHISLFFIIFIFEL